MDAALAAINAVLWHDYVLYVMVVTGLVFTFWSGFSQYRALTHGVHVIRGTYDDPDDPGAINHFQALSTALSAIALPPKPSAGNFRVSPLLATHMGPPCGLSGSSVLR